MAYLVRKVGISHWPDGENCFFSCRDNLPADAISELNTQDNALSVWKIDDESEVEKIGLSFISTLSKRQGKIRLVILPFSDIEQNFDLQNSPEDGLTAIPSAKQYHYNIKSLTYSKLGEIAELIAIATSNCEKQCVFSFRIKDMLEKLRELYKVGQLDPTLLGDYIKKELGVNQQ